MAVKNSQSYGARPEPLCWHFSQPCCVRITSVSTLVVSEGEAREGRAGRGCGKGNLGMFGVDVNQNAFIFNSGTPALSSLPNEAPRTWPNARGG